MSDRLLVSVRLDDNGGCQPDDPDVIAQEPRSPIWVDLDYEDRASVDWLGETVGLDPLVVSAMTAEETRPRMMRHEAGALIILRGVNLNPGADPEDMVSLRLWVDGRRVMSAHRRRLLAVEDVRDQLTAGDGPATPGALLAALARRLVARMGAVISDLDEAIDEIEEIVVDGREEPGLRPRLAALRRQAITLRRYLAPQRAVLSSLQAQELDWLSEEDRLHLREVADATTRYIEDLDAARERAAVTQEEINSRTAEQMNRRMFTLSIAAVLFLPLGFLTGLLGINVAGIPGATEPAAFAIVCGLLVLVAVGQIAVLRRKKWL